MDDYIREYIVLSRAWYAASSRETLRSFKPPVLDSISVSVRHRTRAGDSGEFSLELAQIGTITNAVVLRAYDDAWHVLPKCGDLLLRLAQLSDRRERAYQERGYNRGDIGLGEIETLLRECGFTDATPTTEPTWPRRPAGIDGDLADVPF